MIEQLTTLRRQLKVTEWLQYRCQFSNFLIQEEQSKTAASNVLKEQQQIELARQQQDQVTGGLNYCILVPPVARVICMCHSKST